MTDNEIIIQRLEDGLYIHCNTELTRNHTDTILTMLDAGKEKSKTIVLSLQRGTTFNVSAIQLVFALQKKLAAAGLTMQVCFPEMETIKDLITKTGITKLF
jgi:hypothetical protein